MAWTDDRVLQLKELWGEGKSASQIASMLGGVSRNAVIGKAHRLGLSSRQSVAKSGAQNACATPGPEAARRADRTAAVAAAIVTKERSQVTENKKTRAKTPARDDRAKVGQAPVVPADLPPMLVERSASTAGETPGEEEAASNPVLALVAETERNARKLSLLELNERTCKWPIGDPSKDNFYFCGLPCAPDKPYCAAHVALAYQPMSSRRDRDRNKGRAASA